MKPREKRKSSVWYAPEVRERAAQARRDGFPRAESRRAGWNCRSTRSSGWRCPRHTPPVLVECFGEDGARDALRALAAPHRVGKDRVLFGYRCACLTVRRDR